MKFILFFSLLFVCQITEQTLLSSHNNNIGWVSVSKTDIPLAFIHPDGKESSYFTYLCRTTHQSHFYAGKFYWDSDCYFGRSGLEHKKANFQILAAPPGSVSLIYYNGTMPENTIYVGASLEGRSLYVCRGRANNNKLMLIPGYFEPTAAICYITLGSEIYASSVKVRLFAIALLVKNNYGLVLTS